MNRQAAQLLALIAETDIARTSRSPLTSVDGTTTQEVDTKPLPTSCRSVVVSSGSGGVGRSLLALQTALALGEAGLRVALLDANAGLSHTALLAGLSDWKSLDRLGPGTSPENVAVPLNDHVVLLSGVADWIGDALTDTAASCLDHWLDAADWCVVDAGPRTQPGVVSLLRHADVPVLVTTPEPIPLAETYAALRALHAAGCDDVSIVLNRVSSGEAGRQVAGQLSETAAKFLRRRTAVAATLVDEPPVTRAAHSRQAGRFLSHTDYGRTVINWTQRFRAA